MPAHDVTVYAVWSYKVTYLDTGATGGTAPDEGTYYKGGASATASGNTGGSGGFTHTRGA